jgi:hypothetical protein
MRCDCNIPGQNFLIYTSFIYQLFNANSFKVVIYESGDSAIFGSIYGNSVL